MAERADQWATSLPWPATRAELMLEAVRKFGEARARRLDEEHVGGGEGGGDKRREKRGGKRARVEKADIIHSHAVMEGAVRITAAAAATAAVAWAPMEGATTPAAFAAATAIGPMAAVAAVEAARQQQQQRQQQRKMEGASAAARVIPKKPKQQRAAETASAAASVVPNKRNLAWGYRCGKCRECMLPYSRKCSDTEGRRAA